MGLSCWLWSVSPRIVGNTYSVLIRRRESKLALSPMDEDMLDGHWATLFGITRPQVNKYRMEVLQYLNYDLQISRWTLMMEKLLGTVSQARSTWEMNHLARKHKTTFQTLEQPQNFGNDRLLSNEKRNLRHINRSLRKGMGELEREVRMLSNMVQCVEPTLYPLSVYMDIRTLEVGSMLVELIPRLVYQYA